MSRAKATDSSGRGVRSSTWERVDSGRWGTVSLLWGRSWILLGAIVVGSGNVSNDVRCRQMRIDAHAHQVPAAFRAAAQRRTGAEYELPVVATDQQLAAMDEHGIELAVVSLPPPGVQVGSQQDASPLARLINERYAELVASPPVSRCGR